MRNVTRATAVIAVLVGSSAVLGLVACGSTSTGLVGDASTDATADQSVADSGKDSAQPDVTVSEAGSETGVDAGSDVAVDAAPDVVTTPDGSEAGEGGSPSDAGDASADADAASNGFDGSAAAFPTFVIQTYCEKISRCCVGDASASFNLASCVANFTNHEEVPLTPIGLLFGDPGNTSTEHTFFGPKAQACIAAIDALPCGSAPAATLNSIYTTCAAAYVGKLGVNQTGCVTTFDCAPGNYCGPITGQDTQGVPIVANGTGTGTCLAIEQAGAPCQDYFYSTDCTSQGQPGAFCSTLDGGVQNCLPAQATGTDCSLTGFNQQCTSGLCDPTNDAGAYSCATTAPIQEYLGSDVCAAYGPHPG